MLDDQAEILHGNRGKHSSGSKAVNAMDNIINQSEEPPESGPVATAWPALSRAEWEALRAEFAQFSQQFE